MQGPRFPTGEIALPHCCRKFACAWETVERPRTGAPFISEVPFMQTCPLCRLFGGASPLEQVFSDAGLTMVRAGGSRDPEERPPLPHLESWQVQQPWGWGSGLQF